MPRIKKPDLRGETIKGRTTMAGMEIPELAVRTGIPRSTLYALIRSPDNINVDQMRRIQRSIRMTLDEFLSIYGLQRRDFNDA